MAKRKRNNGGPPPVTLELKWVKDDDGTILRWADITDYDACAKPPHEPRTHILRLSGEGMPRGKRLHHMANWPHWREVVRSIPVGEMREWTVGRDPDAAERFGQPAAPATPATWRDPHGDPPEDDSDVLVRQLDPEEPVVIGRYTSDGWWMCEGVTGLRPLLREGVRGWLHLHEAAAIIDAAKPSAEFGSILAGLVARGTITQEEADRAEGRLDDRS